jgi:ATP/maltotriose-dependent transcriptional regulator MalT
MPEPSTRHAAQRQADPVAEDRRVPAGAGGLAVRLRRLRGMLKRPLRLERRGLHWHLVLVDRRRNPSPLAAPSDAQQLSELGARLLAIDHEHAAAGMRHLVALHGKLRRKGWVAVEAMPARHLARALTQCELLASLEPSPAMSRLVERLRILKTAAEVHEERRALARADDLRAQVEVTETSFDDFHDTERGWLDTVSPKAGSG